MGKNKWKNNTVMEKKKKKKQNGNHIELPEQRLQEISMEKKWPRAELNCGCRSGNP